MVTPALQAQFQSGLWTEKQANFWYMGKARGLDFTTSPPQVLNDGQSYATKGGGTMSTPSGSLLFYSDGLQAWNRNHVQMPNGSGLSVGGGQATQNGLTIPVPGNPDLYYVISVAKSNSNGGIFYSEVDMRLDGGLGNVTSRKRVRLHPAGVAEKLAAVYHTDEKKVWVVGHRSNHLDLAHSNEFVSFLISETGTINTTPVVSATGLPFHQFKDGQMKISPDGKKLIVVHSQGSVGPNVLELFNFDATTGIVSAPILTIDDRFTAFGSLFGVEFSPDSKFIYAAESQGPSRIYQYNITSNDATTIRNTEVIIAEIPGFTETFFGMQAGIDGKIYVANGNKDYHSVINYPNNAGLACGFQYQVTGSTTATSDDSFPGFIQSYFESGILYDKTCHGDVTAFSLIRIPGITSVSWNFGDSASTSNTSAALEPTHNFTAPGVYTVTATITSNSAIQVTATQVTINALPVANKPNAIKNCDVDDAGNLDFNLAAQDSAILSGQTATDFLITYHNNSGDAQSGNNAISGDLTLYNSAGETIYARIENKLTGCFAVTDFQLIVVPPINPSGLEVKGCSPLDLNSVIPNLGVPANQVTVSFHNSESDAETGNSPIPHPEAYTFTSGSGTLYLRIVDIDSGCINAVPLAIVQGDCRLPQGFSPNGDGVNDSFDLTYLAAQNGISSLEVFNRNGRQVYKQQNYTSQWLGEDNNGNKLPTGTYFYVAKLNTPHPEHGKVITKWVYLQANN